MTQMSSNAKTWLSDTVRSLRSRLIKDLNEALESTYRLGIASSRADLDQERASKRRRWEEWLEEQVRASHPGAKAKAVEEARQRHRDTAVKLVAATWLNRLVVLGQMEALKLVRTPVLTGGWNSSGFAEFREFAPVFLGQGSEGLHLILDIIFQELSLDLPGLFGRVGLIELVPIPTATLRHLVESLQASGLSESERQSLWRDDTLLGWIYQFWNDPEREALDQKIREGGKIENHEIAAKTQLFTDRYMVEWLLQNSLGQIWLELCQSKGWTAEVVASGTLDALEGRRAAWRAKREAGEVDEEALMPLENDLEERWKYYVPRPFENPGFAGIPSCLADLKLLDPACGSGHFLVMAFDLLLALYQEEDRHLGQERTTAQIAVSILENNLHGLDIDPRAVQIAAAALWLKLKSVAPKAEFGRLNLVASNLGLTALPKDDPALRELVAAVEAEAGVPQHLTLRLVETLKGADYLGSLLKVGDAIDKTLSDQSSLFTGRAMTPEEARSALVGQLEQFVARHSGAEDLGLRLKSEQLAAGVRYLRLLREGQYHLVVGNPPYQNVGKATDLTYPAKHYPEAKSDLYAAFLLRGLEFCFSGGISSLLTLRGWMFLGTFEKLRARILQNQLLLIGDLDRGAFELILDEVVAVAIPVVRKLPAGHGESIAVLPTPRDDRTRDNKRTLRKKCALLGAYQDFCFRAQSLAAIPGQPLVYWWPKDLLAAYSDSPHLGRVSPAKVGTQTGNNIRFLRMYWELRTGQIELRRLFDNLPKLSSRWFPLIKGAAGQAWFEPLFEAINWQFSGTELRNFYRDERLASRPQNLDCNFKAGIAFSMIGSGFSSRAHRFRSVFECMGSSVFPVDIPQTLCLLNSSRARYILESLNPGVHFQVGDVNRLPMFPIESAQEIVAVLEREFTQHEQARETSVEFQRPGPSPWRVAQEWAQRAVDRAAGEPLPDYVQVLDPLGERDELSYRLGLALGRFDENGIVAEPKEEALTAKGALPHGILFLSASGGPDGTDHPAGAGLKEQRDYLRSKFFSEDHLKRYEKRPIYFPLSSEKRSYVAYCSIHRWHDSTLQVLLADYLVPERLRLQAELADAVAAKIGGDKKSQVAAHRRSEELTGLYGELEKFIKEVEQIAERGAPPFGHCTPREVDAAYRMDLDDGVMINSASLWPLLAPQWKDPQKWWVELCEAKGKKDYDWAHLAARYFPTRVDGKCQKDPSLAVAHGCFWKYHPEKAYQWELRLQSPDELGPEFRLDEVDSDRHRQELEAAQPQKVQEMRDAEQRRRLKKADQGDEDQGQLDFEEDGDD